MKVNANDGRDGWRHTAYLNGVKVEYCVEADDEAGYVLVIKHEGNRIVLDAQGVPITERLEGDVRIEPPPLST